MQVPFHLIIYINKILQSKFQEHTTYVCMYICMYNIYENKLDDRVAKFSFWGTNTA